MHQHSENCDCHTANSQTKQKQLAIALLLVGSFAGVELAVGHSSHSLALVAESGHLVSDCFALLLALLATRIAQSPPKWGWLGEGEISLVEDRSIETWAALINGIGLVVVALLIGWESLNRLQIPSVEIASQPMLITAIVGLVVNGFNIALLHQGSDHDLNLRAAFLHVVADALGAIGVILAAIAVTLWHWNWADGAISLAIAFLILLSAIPLITQSWKLLQQASMRLKL
ncbi:cation diffusion facilitator family transporter [Phormidesmis sp. 146-12]